MGLDMYLYRSRYVKNWDHQAKEEKYKITIKRGSRSVDSEDISYIKYEAGCWRKANAIHAWFVKNCNDGIDNGGSMYVSEEKIKELLAVVKELLSKIKLKKGKLVQSLTLSDTGEWKENLINGKIIANPEVCEKLLPTQSGFFFGSTEYDEWYLEDLKLTKDILEKALKDSEYDEFEYYASW